MGQEKETALHFHYSEKACCNAKDRVFKDVWL